jgi:hypothetical protein
MRGWLMIWEPDEIDRVTDPTKDMNCRRGARAYEFFEKYHSSSEFGRLRVYSNFKPAEYGAKVIWFDGRVNAGFSERSPEPEGDFTRLSIAENREIQVSSDQLGFKSFFYTKQHNCWIFSNSLEALCLCPEVGLLVDEKIIASFLVSNMVTRVDPCSTPFQGIFRSRPGSLWVLKNGSMEERVVWSLNQERVQEKKPTLRIAAEQLHTQLASAIRDRLPSDGKIALAQSGGLDSSLVGAIAHGIGAEITGFTISYESIHKEDDWKYSEMVTKKFGWKQHRLISDQIPFYRPNDWDLDLMRSTVLSATANLADHMANHSAIGFNGLSADNILAKGLPNLHRVQTYPALLGKILKYREIPPIGIRKPKRVKPTFDSSKFPWINQEKFLDSDGDQSYETLMSLPLKQYHPTHNYLSMSLSRFNWTERFRERLSYEALDPFFDIRLVRFSLSLDPFTYFQRKEVQRVLAEKLLPKEVANRKKTILGDVYSSVLKVADPELVDQWKPHPSIESFVQRDVIPPLTKGNLDPMTLFHATKPFWLNSWYEGLDQFLKFKNKLTKESQQKG